MATNFLKNGERIIVDGGLFRDDTVCHVTSLEYDFVNQRGVLHMPPHNSTDMKGCIALFTAIDPGVRMVKAISGGGGTIRDSLYVKDDESGKWLARFRRAEEAVHE